MLGVLLIEREPAEAANFSGPLSRKLPVIGNYFVFGLQSRSKQNEPIRRTAGNDSQDRAGIQT